MNPSALKKSRLISAIVLLLSITNLAPAVINTAYLVVSSHLDSQLRLTFGIIYLVNFTITAWITAMFYKERPMAFYAVAVIQITSCVHMIAIIYQSSIVEVQQRLTDKPILACLTLLLSLIGLCLTTSKATRRLFFNKPSTNVLTFLQAICRVDYRRECTP